MSKASEFIRTNFAEGDAVRDAGLEIPADVKRYSDITYGNKGEHPQWQMLDVYRPANVPEDQKLPVIVVIHGGGWVYGDKEVYKYYSASLCQRGFAVVCYSYRLAPEYTFPSSLEDSCAVANWIVENENKYGFDLTNIFGVGDSAGGTLIGITAAFLTNKEYADKFDFTVSDKFSFKGIAFNCAAFEIKSVSETDDNMGSLMDDLFGKKVTDEDLDVMNAGNYITAAYPPSFLMSATGDFLKDELPKMAAVMIKNSVPFTCKYYTSPNGELGHVFHCNMRLPEAEQCNDDEVEFFKNLM
ncbi:MULTISPECIES: alpha/beta hydrolase [unclassified Butyrivibrio]|uniref:alpha/beta hydrolase n=1 Tax=unclassified Butyrivibrio TaxID=2639466 RepID=UPI000422BD11|nr:MULTISPECIES: alpha/beta hydrolase [unclassified Butyrivibrio]